MKLEERGVLPKEDGDLARKFSHKRRELPFRSSWPSEDEELGVEYGGGEEKVAGRARRR